MRFRRLLPLRRTFIELVHSAAMVAPTVSAACQARPNDATDANVPSSGRNMPDIQSEVDGDRPLSSHTNMSSHSGHHPQPHVDAKQSSGHASLTSNTSCSSGNAQYLPPQHPHPHHHHHHHSRHISHHEEAQMRELDADILELGIDQPGTPVLTAAHAEALLGRSGSSSGLPSASIGEQSGNSDHISPSRLPLLPESAAVTLGVGKEDRVLSASVHSTGGGDNVGLPIASSDASLGKANSDEQVAVAAAPNFPPSPVNAYRRCLSGDMETIATVGQSGSDVNLVGSAAEALKTPAKSTRRGDAGEISSDNGRSSTAAEDRKQSPNSVANGSSTTASSTIDEAVFPCGNRSILDDAHDATIIVEGNDGHKQQQISSPTQLATAKDCRERPASVVHDASADHIVARPRSKSLSRALNEAVQFAEAVGEAPPTNEDEVRIIMDEDDNQSDDDSDVDMLNEEEMAAEMAEMEKDVDAVESSFRRGSSFRIDSDLGLPKSPYVSKNKFCSRDRDVDIGAVLDASLLDLSLQSTAGGTGALPSAPDLVGSSPSQIRRNEFASKHDEKEADESDEKRKDIAGRPRGSRLYPRLPPLKQAPRGTEGMRSHHHMTLLNKKGPNGVAVDGDESDHSSSLSEYKGIHSKQLEVTNRGIARGNYAKLHRKAWLEVSDKYHRYGKNLRLYYKHWESLGHPTNQFFDWLDSKGEAAGQPLPNLPDCPRAELDSDTVLYITNPEVQERYRLSIVTGIVVDGEEEKGSAITSDDESGGYSDASSGDAILVDADEEPVKTGHEGWIFVLRDHALYAGQKVTSVSGRSKQRFHHSSFFGGKAVAAAGIIITDQHGRIKRFYPHSGHYRPTEAHMQRMLYFLQQGGFDLTTFEVDTQQILHVSRTVRTAPKGGASAPDHGDAAVGTAAAAPKKCKKTQSLHLKPALFVACYLAHKARMIGEGVFGQIHKIRTEGAACVSEALEIADEGGYWKKLREYYTDDLSARGDEA